MSKFGPFLKNFRFRENLSKIFLSPRTAENRCKIFFGAGWENFWPIMGGGHQMGGIISHVTYHIPPPPPPTPSAPGPKGAIMWGGGSIVGGVPEKWLI